MLDDFKMRTCELSVIKYLLFGFNLLFAISGIGIIIAGALVLSDVGEFRHFMEGQVLAPPVVLIVAGCIVFLVASLGCYGAIRESYYMLMAFALCLLVIFIIELAVGIAAAVYKNDFHKGIKQLMRESMNKYETNEADRMAWDNLQTKLKCCGVDKNNDWILLLGKRPLSCCHATRDGSQPPEAIHCNSAKTGDEILYSDGCFDMIEYKAEEASKVLIGVGIGIAFVEICVTVQFPVLLRVAATTSRNPAVKTNSSFLYIKTNCHVLTAGLREVAAATLNELIGIVLACWLASAIKSRS